MICCSFVRNVQDLQADGNTPYETRMENHSNDQSFRLVHWLNIIRFLRRTSHGSTNLARNYQLDCSSDTHRADSMECKTHLRNVQDLLSDGKTPYDRRFEQPFKGPIIPFGSLVEPYPTSAKDQSRIHQFGKKVLPGLFLG